MPSRRSSSGTPAGPPAPSTPWSAPTAPAPTEEIDTITPRPAPTSTVARAIVASSTRSMRVRNFSMTSLRKMREVAVNNSAKHNTELTRPRAAPVDRSSCQSTSNVSRLAGMLPAASRITAGQWMVRAQPWTTTPPLLVAAAYNRSVPTAVDGCTPNNKIRIGVISDPPPTPVRPTRRPTLKPEAT